MLEPCAKQARASLTMLSMMVLAGRMSEMEAATVPMLE